MLAFADYINTSSDSVLSKYEVLLNSIDPNKSLIRARAPENDTSVPLNFAEAYNIEGVAQGAGATFAMDVNEHISNDPNVIKGIDL